MDTHEDDFSSCTAAPELSAQFMSLRAQADGEASIEPQELHDPARSPPERIVSQVKVPQAIDACPLLRATRDVRLIVYEFILAECGFEMGELPMLNPYQRRFEAPPITKTCRTIKQEVLPLYKKVLQKIWIDHADGLWESRIKHPPICIFPGYWSATQTLWTLLYIGIHLAELLIAELFRPEYEPPSSIERARHKDLRSLWIASRKLKAVPYHIKVALILDKSRSSWENLWEEHRNAGEFIKKLCRMA